MTGIISPLEELAPDPVEPPTDLEAIRDLVLKAHPDVVPELVQGDSIGAILASVEPAQSAYARLSTTFQPATLTPVPNVPAGGNPPIVIDLDRLPASEKIKRGLASSRRTV